MFEKTQQKLSGELKNIPTNREETLSVQNKVLTDNNLEENQQSGKTGQDLRVPVLNMRGEPLMPTTQAKARHLLKKGKSKVEKLTIKLLKEKMKNISQMARINISNLKIINDFEIRKFDEYSKEQIVATAVISDGTSRCNLDLWNEETEKFKQGDKLKVINGFAKHREFTQDVHLQSGRWGMLQKL